MPRSSLSQILRQATQTLHDEVEAALPLLRDGLTTAEYRQHLRALWAVVWATEQALLPWHRPLSALWDGGGALELRAPLLRQDLMALGDISCPVTPSVWRPPPVVCPSLPHAVGCWYVLGGSRLGGQVIARHLRRHSGLNAQRGLAYYGACTATDGKSFRAFARVIDRGSHWRQHQEAIVQGAVATFDHWSDALCKPRHENGNGREKGAGKHG